MVIYNDWYIVGVKADEFSTKILFIWFFFSLLMTTAAPHEHSEVWRSQLPARWQKNQTDFAEDSYTTQTYNARNGGTVWSSQQEVEGYNRKWACLVKKKQLTSNMHELLSFTERTLPSQLHTQHCHIRTLSHIPLPAPSFELFSLWLKEDEFRCTFPSSLLTGSHVGFIMHTTPVQMSTNYNSKTHMDNSQKLRIS